MMELVAQSRGRGSVFRNIHGLVRATLAEDIFGHCRRIGLDNI